MGFVYPNFFINQLTKGPMSLHNVGTTVNGILSHYCSVLYIHIIVGIILYTTLFAMPYSCCGPNYIDISSIGHSNHSNNCETKEI